MKEVLKYRDYMKMFSARLISRFGDSIDVIVFAFLAYELTGSEIFLATVLVANVLPGIFLSSFSGSVVEFLPKKLVIVTGDIVRGGLVFFTGILYVRGELATWHLLGITFIMSTIETFVAPSKSSVLPRMIDKEYYFTVNTSMESWISFIELIGVGIAGAIIGYFGMFVPMVIDMITFLISAAIVSTAKFPLDEKREFTMKNYWKVYGEGIKFIIDKKVILTMTLAMAGINFFLAPIDAFIPSYAKNIMKMGADGISYFLVFLAVGSIIGGVIGKKIGDKVGLKLLMTMGLVSLGVGISVLSVPGFIANINPVYVVCITAVILGVAIRFAQAAMRTIAMSLIPDNMRARTAAIGGMMISCAMPGGAMLAGVLVTVIGLRYVILVFGVLVLILSIVPVLVYGNYEKKEKSFGENSSNEEGIARSV